MRHSNYKLAVLVTVTGLICCFVCSAQLGQQLEVARQSDSNNPPQNILSPGMSSEEVQAIYMEQFDWTEAANGLKVGLIKQVTDYYYDQITLVFGVDQRNLKELYFQAPGGKFARFELLNANGDIAPPKPEAGAKLSWVGRNLDIYETNFPLWVTSPGGLLEGHFPRTISSNLYPSYKMGGLAGYIRPDESLSIFRLSDLYSITNEGDYKLTICPVLYKSYVTNQAILNRVNLPCVSKMVHLKPR